MYLLCVSWEWLYGLFLSFKTVTYEKSPNSQLDWWFSWPWTRAWKFVLLVNVTVVFCSKHRNNHVMGGKQDRKGDMGIRWVYKMNVRIRRSNGRDSEWRSGEESFSVLRMFKILKLQKFSFMGDDVYAEGAKSLLLSYRLLECVEFIDLRTLLYNLKVFFF